MLYRSLRFVQFAALAWFLGLVLFAIVPGMHAYVVSGKVSWALKRELRDNGATRVALAQLTDFRWDELYLVGPYTPTDIVCKRFRVPANDCRAVIPAESNDDGQMVLVFSYQGKVVHAEKHVRFFGDFTPVAREPYTPETAVFDVRSEDVARSGEPWLKLVPVKSPIAQSEGPL